jgi:ornithine cyclodeaminase/alanine dehydrogenase-like protein (mu-crystallin family)
MSGTVLRLRAYEVWSALEVVDSVAVLAEELIGRTVDRLGHRRQAAARLVPWRGAGSNGVEEVLLDHPDAPLPCVVPAQSLRAALSASLASVAARCLLLTGGITVAMIGTADTAQRQLSVIARHVPDISHVALYQAGREAVEPRLADLLELSGIGLSVVPTLAEAVFGANLVVATGGGTGGGAGTRDLDTLRFGQLAHGAVVVNATGEDLPADLVDQVDQVFVDDLGLLADHLDRRVVAAHLAPPDVADRDGAFGRRIVADLGQLLTDQHAGRMCGDDIVLVELLGVHELNAELAHRICLGATRTGLGQRIAN